MDKAESSLVRAWRTLCLASLAAVASFAISPAALPQDALLEDFRDPPHAARPRVWWHWMNGNVTEEGIRRDLEWMTRVGIGGTQIFDANLDTPQLVDHRLTYMSPRWRKAVSYAAELAARFDLELSIAASPGWSETGGPRSARRRR